MMPKNSRSIAYQYRMDMPHIKLRGDISERAKKQGVDVQSARDYDFGQLLAIRRYLIIIESIIATKIAKNDFREKAEDTEIVANGKNNILVVA